MDWLNAHLFKPEIPLMVGCVRWCVGRVLCVCVHVGVCVYVCVHACSTFIPPLRSIESVSLILRAKREHP